MASEKAHGSTTHQEQLNLAMSLGLTAYEARAYLASLERGEAGASQIATQSRIPRGRIYEVLASLHAKGLVAVVSAKPLRYLPVSLKAYVDRRKAELQAAERDLEKVGSTLMAKVRPRAIPEPTGDFLLFRKRRAVYGKFRDMINGATNEVLVSASEACVIRQDRFLADAVRSREKPVVVQLLTDITARNAGVVRDLIPHADVHHTALGNRAITVLVVDRREVLICHWNPDDEDPFFGEDVGLWSTNPGVVESLRTIVTDGWERGTAARERLLELEEPQLRDPSPLPQAGPGISESESR